jgi:soluble lytic murein transglycosylase-like protein
MQTRKRVMVLTVLAAFLILDGPASAPGAVPTSTARSAAMDVPAIGRVLHSSNPPLTRMQLERIASAIHRYSTKHGLDPELVTAVLLVESAARPWAESPKGAQGLMQVMPYVMSRMGFAGNFSTIESNVEAGCIILAENIRRLGEEDGISAYFWGSEIRSASYLGKVLAARARLRGLRPS